MKLVAAKDTEELVGYVIYWMALLLLNCVPASLILIKTSKQSLLRVAWLPCWALLAYHLCHSVCTICRSLAARGVMGGNLILVMVNILGMLTMRRLDDQELVTGGVYKTADGLMTKILRTCLHFFNLRAIGTPWQVNVVTLCPKFLAAKRDASGKQNRTWWILRTALIAIWQYMFLNLIEVQALQQSPEETRIITGDDLEWPRVSYTAEQWAMRAAVSLPSAIGPPRVGIDMWYRLLSLTFVVLGLSSPEAWPPLFGTIFSTSTVRGSWAGMTHRLVRLPLGTVNDFVMRDVVGMSTKSSSGRLLSVILIFLFSGLMHALIEIFDDDGIPAHERWQVVLYWLLSVGGIVLEEAVQRIWGSLFGPPGSKRWHKVVGHTWVGVFFAIVHPIFFYPAMRQGDARKEMVPVDVVTGMGLPTAAGIVVVGGILVMLSIGGEV